MSQCRSRCFDVTRNVDVEVLRRSDKDYDDYGDVDVEIRSARRDLSEFDVFSEF
ncbi:hypothetical protein PILCRDRAFT_17522 [Piloderma croceum F 1598]|uniref:Uncharacterized protein n=1 Tax=Piloderma croceum (strain F 1598) TaxID=765440 RepID=A0A0C3ET34_PILCF|nr:hypothetical protein PILCRDRAFT_17522 [Piloderma croceum F 1598]